MELESRPAILCGRASLCAARMALYGRLLMRKKIIVLFAGLIVAPAHTEESGELHLIFGTDDASLISGPWSILNPGNPVYTGADGKPYFNFPNSSPSVNYLTTPVNGISAKAAGMRMAYTVTTLGAPVFDYRTNPNNSCGPGYPGTVRLFFQRRGDDFSGAGAFQQYRYWSQAGYRELAPGAYFISATFDPAQWTDVYGKAGSAFPDRFLEALRNAADVGVTFGGGCFFGHGVFVDPRAGTARFRIDEFGFQ